MVNSNKFSPIPRSSTRQLKNITRHSKASRTNIPCANNSPSLTSAWTQEAQMKMKYTLSSHFTATTLGEGIQSCTTTRRKLQKLPEKDSSNFSTSVRAHWKPSNSQTWWALAKEISTTTIQSSSKCRMFSHAMRSSMNSRERKFIFTNWTRLTGKMRKFPLIKLLGNGWFPPRMWPSS